MIPALILLAIIVLPVIYNFISLFKPPYLDNYFAPGDMYVSELEGISQRVIKQVGNRVYVELTILPGAAGPPEHKHLGFHESGQIKSGMLTIKVNDEIKKNSAGEKFYFPVGVYHTFYNESDQDVIIGSDDENDFLPVDFAYALAKFYPLFETKSKFKMVHFLYKMSLFGKGFDSYVKEAPVAWQKMIKTILKPYARILGYTLYDEKSKPRKQN